MSEKQGILLESGTGELEILIFKVSTQLYAINVIKVKEIITINNLSKLPSSHGAVAGVSLARGEMISIVDSWMVLEGTKKPNLERSMTLICQFNQLTVGFAIDEVIGIKRIGWQKLVAPDQLNENSLVIGNIEIDDKIVMLLDFEKIVMDISPSTGITVDRLDRIEHKYRGDVKIVVADDSPMIRKVLNDALTAAGFKKLKFFDDGKQALDYLTDLASRYPETLKEYVDLLITDIEMPQLDGHALTKRVKEHKILKELPVVIFSSLITHDLLHKGVSVGADAQMSKPEIDGLVQKVDELLSIE